MRDDRCYLDWLAPAVRNSLKHGTRLFFERKIVDARCLRSGTSSVDGRDKPGHDDLNTTALLATCGDLHPQQPLRVAAGDLCHLRGADPVGALEEADRV